MTEAHAFRAAIELGGKTATGIEVPADLVTSLGAGKRPTVRVTLGPRSYTYTTTVATMGGRFLIPLSAVHRAAAGVAAGDVVDVQLETNTGEREVPVPADLAAALAQEPAPQRFFDNLAYSYRKEWVRWIEDAKKPETRASRLAVTLEALRAGKRTR
jgi:Bacteriocin-protection, YdeI or OmpD-Associated/Domain of unknown function (DUF1905)